MKINDRILDTLLELARGPNDALGAAKTAQIVRENITKHGTDLAQKLLIPAIKGRSGIDNLMVQMLKAYFTDAQFLQAQRDANRIVEDASTTISLTEAEDAASTAATTLPTRTIFDVIKGKDILALQKMIETKIDLNQTNEQNGTPVQVAAMLGFKEILTILLDAGASATGLDIAALVGGNQEVIDYLTEVKLYDLKDLTYKAAEKDAFTNILGKLLLTLPGGVEIHLCEEGLNALHIATIKGAVANIATAIEKKISVESKTKDGFTALQKAVIEGQVESFTALIDHNAEVFVEESSTGANILHLAVKVGGIDITTKIMGLDVAPGLAKGTDSTGANPLHTAATLGKNDIMAAILKTLPDTDKMEAVNATDKNGQTVLSMAQDESTQNLLREHGAKEPELVTILTSVTDATTEPEQVPKEPHTPPNSPLYQRSIPSTPASAMKLPASVNTDISSPLTALLSAMANDDEAEAALVLASTYDPLTLLNTKLVAIKNPEESGSIARSSAGDTQNTNILQLSHALGKGNALRAMTNIWNDENWYTLIDAIQSNNSIEVSKLLDDEITQSLRNMKFTIANANTKNCAGNLIAANSVQSVWVSFNSSQNTSTLLHVAAALGGNATIAGILLKRGVEINAQDAQGYTAAHYAVENQNEAIIPALKDHSANLDLKSCGAQETPVEMSAYLGYIRIYEQLAGDAIPAYTHVIKAIKSKSTDMFRNIISKSKQLLGLQSSIDGGNILHSIAKDGVPAMAIALDNQSHDYFNILVSARDKLQNIPLHIAATRDDSTYHEFCLLLSYRDKVVIKKGFLGLTKKTTTEHEDISSWQNSQSHTPSEAHTHHMKMEEAYMIEQTYTTALTGDLDA